MIELLQSCLQVVTWTK